MTNYTKIYVGEKNYERLQSRKQSRGESMDSLIIRLLEKYDGVI